MFLVSAFVILASTLAYPTEAGLLSPAIRLISKYMAVEIEFYKEFAAVKLA